jgi:4-hydroxyphenylpyruvate dioxygenase
MPGQGEFDMTGFIDAVETTGYQGALSLEIFNDRFRAGSASSVAIDGHRSLLWLLDGASQRRGRPVAGSTPMPAAEEVEGVAFIEFAVASADRHDFVALLAAMGFAEIATHRSKAVSLHAQGDIRFVVNSEKTGFAHSYQLTHGTSVCALALKVGDGAGTVARAAALLDTTHAGVVGPGEADIPAVRGLGGSLLYFIDGGARLSRWAETDFVPTGREAAGVGLLRVDHVSQTVQYEEMLTWLLFYTSLFAMRKTPSQAVMDPGGVVQSQVIESGLDRSAGGLRLVLNGSQSHRTLSGRFVSEFFGSGVQHIALSTTDIRQTVRHFQAAGVRMQPIPENYYDDLETRADLDVGEIEELKALGILHDQDQSGTFLQAYTLALDGSFFFEIVQRDGYAGYGAANAGVRLAAQARLARPAGFPSR